jgi:dolichol-phosphate mannosyltransferase/undecaprenyl-phosphate 4-deoxy-4-formamido-L-arabinose transferase
MDISVVIPVYNSADCLPELLKQVKRVLDQTGKTYEVILVDDASQDNSWSVLQNLAPLYPQMSAIRLTHNLGQAAATLVGLSHARGSVVVTMDDDLQHRPDQLFKLLDRLNKDPEIDCVFGYFEKKMHAWYRNVASKVIRAINASAIGLPKGVVSSGFRAMRRHVVQGILAQRMANPVIIVLLLKATSRVTSVPVEHAPRFAGRSNYTLRKQFRLAWDNMYNVTLLPLRLVSIFGMTVCVLSIFLVIWIIIRYLSGGITVPGWTTLVVLTSFFSGAILFSLGVLGEYMMRLFKDQQSASSVVERERIGWLTEKTGG